MYNTDGPIQGDVEGREENDGSIKALVISGMRVVVQEVKRGWGGHMGELLEEEIFISSIETSSRFWPPINQL